MKGKSILFSLLSLVCITTASGCGEAKHSINAYSSSKEQGIVQGGGSYEKGDTVTLKVYPNLGCSPDKLIFTKNGQGTTTEYGLNYSGEGYYSYQFPVNDETIGSYEAIFACDTNSVADLNTVQSLNRVVRLHPPTGMVIIDNTGSTDPQLNENNVFKVRNGSKIDNIQWYNNKRLKWYTDEHRTQVYNFSNSVTSDLVLYGSIDALFSEEDLVKEALNKFKSSSNLVVKSDGETAAIINLDKAYPVDPSVSADPAKLDITVSASGGNNKFVYQNNTYYEYNGTKVAGFKLDTQSEITLPKIKDLYKFIEIVGIQDSDLIDANVKTTENVTQIVDGKACEELVVNSSGKEFKLYISNGVIYKTVVGSVATTITYPTSQISGTSMPSNTAQMYLARMYSSNTTLNAALNEMNIDFSKTARIIPNNGETVKTYIEDNMMDLLKQYDYTLHSGNSCGAISVTENVYNAGDAVQSHLKLCFKVKAEFAAVKNAIETLEAGGYKINTSTNVFGETITKESTIATGTNLLVNSATQPGDMNSITWRTITNLRDLENNYYNFKYDETVGYSFYKEKDDSVPYLVVKLDSDNRVSKVTYYEFNGANPNERNTYLNEFDYS